MVNGLNPYYKDKIQNNVCDAIQSQDLADEEQHYANRVKSNIENGQFDKRLPTSLLDHNATSRYDRFQSVPNLLEKVLYDCFIGGPGDQKLQVMPSVKSDHPKEYTLRQRAEANKKASEANWQFLGQHRFKKQ